MFAQIMPFVVMFALFYGFLVVLALDMRTGDRDKPEQCARCALRQQPHRKGWNFCPQCASPLTTADADGKMRLKCTSCDFVHWDNPKSVSVVLIPKGDGIVVIRRKLAPKAGMLALPGGFVDKGEDPWMAAVREAREETHLEIEIDKLFGTFNLPDGNQNLFFFLAKPVTDMPTAGDDASEAYVFSADNLPKHEIAFSSHAEMIERWLREQTQR